MVDTVNSTTLSFTVQVNSVPDIEEIIKGMDNKVSLTFYGPRHPAEVESTAYDELLDHIVGQVIQGLDVNLIAGEVYKS